MVDPLSFSGTWTSFLSSISWLRNSDGIQRPRICVHLDSFVFVIPGEYRGDLSSRTEKTPAFKSGEMNRCVGRERIHPSHKSDTSNPFRTSSNIAVFRLAIPLRSWYFSISRSITTGTRISIRCVYIFFFDILNNLLILCVN
jgi:hypothetical protein